MTAARKLKTVPVKAGDIIQIGDNLEIRVQSQPKKAGGRLRLELFADQEYPISVAKSRIFQLNCKRKDRQ